MIWASINEGPWLRVYAVGALCGNLNRESEPPSAHTICMRLNLGHQIPPRTACCPVAGEMRFAVATDASTGSALGVVRARGFWLVAVLTSAFGHV